MALPLSEMASVSIDNYAPTIADNASKNVAGLAYLKKAGNKRPFSGGVNILQNLDYALNSTAGWMSGYDTLDNSPQTLFSAAEFAIKQATVGVTISGLEEIQNSGDKTRMFDLLKSRLSNAETSMLDLLAAGFYSDGTGTGGKQMTGLQALISDAPTSGTVGGIDRATYSFWRNIMYDASSDGGAAASAANIESYMNAVWKQLVRGVEKPNVILADSNYWGFYEEAVVSRLRVAPDTVGESGFPTLKYKGIDVVLDGGNGGYCPANHMYFLNTKYLHYRPHQGTEMKVLPSIQSINQWAFVRYIVWAGNLTASNCRMQGVLKA